jgi:hypothetical protein
MMELVRAGYSMSCPEWRGICESAEGTRLAVQPVFRREVEVREHRLPILDQARDRLAGR